VVVAVAGMSQGQQESDRNDAQRGYGGSESHEGSG
jgi:hypothetical protein